MTPFSNKLIYWYLEHKRDLPWRETKDPYSIWLSEIILQQTRVDQGLPYFERFMTQYPTLEDLANAPLDDVLKLWQGLGYYSRARNMHTAAQYVVNELKGIFPQNYDGLKKLKGVGDYTASAIASICYDEPVAVVDGNVYRVLSRFFGIDTPIDSSAGSKEFKSLAQSLIDRERPATFNQALMEFGATQCKPKNPYCLHCPFNESCVALQQNRIDSLPVKKGKTKIRNRHFNYLVFLDKSGRTVLRKREGKGIWKGLYEFPVVESDGKMWEIRFRESAPFKKAARGLTIMDIAPHNKQPIIHKLSHQHLHVVFWIAQVESLEGVQGEVTATPETFAVPIVIARFLEAFDFQHT